MPTIYAPSSDELRLERVAALKTTCKGSEDSQPAMSLLENVNALEEELLETLLPDSKVALKPMDWDNAGLPCDSGVAEVCGRACRRTGWKKMAALSESVGDLSKIGAQMRDRRASC